MGLKESLTLNAVLAFPYVILAGIDWSGLLGCIETTMAIKLLRLIIIPRWRTVEEEIEGASKTYFQED